MKVVALNGEPRKGLGKKGTKAVRNAGLIPCVLYGGDEPIHFSVGQKGIKPIIYTPEFKVAEITIDGNSYKAILKDVQFHPVTDDIRHIDFLQLVEGKPLKLEVPVRFTGSAPGVKVGGKLQQALRRVKIKTTLEHMVDHVMLDVSDLEMGFAIRVRDIEPQEGVEIMNAPGIPVASIEVPRALRSAEAEAEEGEEAEAVGEEAGTADEE